jgi:precorrin-2 dehydrogenase/sirohydrochlorin ferrochelatase
VPLYPLSLKLNGRPCLVVGGGAVAERKVASLLECGADVTVVAPDATDQIRSASGRIKFIERPFELSDVAGALLVIAATNNPGVNSAVADAARASGALVNVVDVPDLCDFYVPALVTRGDLQITVSTGGASPALAKRIRIDLDRQFGPEFEAYLELLARVPNRARRNKAEEQFLESPALRLIAEGRVKDAEQIMSDCLRMAEEGA